MIRLLLPGVLLPATTALGTLLPNGREEGILHGANVVMPNLSRRTPGKSTPSTTTSSIPARRAAESLGLLRESLEKIGYEIPVSRGDSLIC